MGSSETDVSMTTYSVRWYLLCVLSLHSCLFNAAWAEWGPIAQAAKAVYGWSDTDVYMLTNVGNVGTVLSLMPVAWLVDTKGLRWSLVISTAITTLGLGLRCITQTDPVASGLIFTAQFLNGVGGAVDTVAPATLSETWFPLQQRVTATCISLLFSCVGGAVAFILGPTVVPEPDQYCVYNMTLKDCNMTVTRRPTVVPEPDQYCVYNMTLKDCNMTVTRNLSLLGGRIKILNYIEFGCAVLIMLAVIAYFPNKPKFPPSKTASKERIKFTAGFKRIARSGRLWHLTLIFALSNGVFGAWISTLDVTLKHFDVTQKEAGHFSFFGSIAGTFMGLALARFSDKFRKSIKLFMVAVYIGATVLFVVFTLQCLEVLPKNTALFYFTCISGGTLITGIMSLFYELACETAYPVAEGVTSGFLCLVQNLFGVFFLCISLIPNIGYKWVNWTLVISIGVCAPGLVLFRETYNRLDIDMNKPSDGSVPYQSIQGYPEGLDSKNSCTSDPSMGSLNSSNRYEFDVTKAEK